MVTMIATVVSAARLRRPSKARLSRRYSGANRIAITTPHSTALYSGSRIQPKPIDAATSSRMKNRFSEARIQ